jgi:hypothetical protein
MTSFDFARLDGRMLDEASAFFEEEGYCILHGLKEAVTNLYHPVLCETAGVSPSEWKAMLDPDSEELVLSEDLRKKLSRVSTTSSLALNLIDGLKPLLARLLGPGVHVSRDFHAQFKCGATRRVGYGGYDSRHNFMEVHGAYQLHQDFTGASLPTSPSAIILWVGLNDCPDWPVRLYPRSHKLGLLCRQFISVDHERLAQFSAPIEFEAKPGTGIIFNSLVLHGTGHGGPQRRVSCDIRFFPSCPYLQSPLYALVESPAAFIQERLAVETGSTLQAPLFEHLALAGRMGEFVHAPAHSILNWANYLNEVCNGDPDRAVAHLKRFANTRLGMDTAETYVQQFHGFPMNRETLDHIRGLMGVPEKEPVSVN